MSYSVQVAVYASACGYLVKGGLHLCVLVCMLKMQKVRMDACVDVGLSEPFQITKAVKC